MSGTTVPLAYPVTHQGTEYTELIMRRPKVRDDKVARKAASNPADQELVLFGNLCEVAPEVMDELDMADYVALQNTYRGFFSAVAPQGETSSDERKPS